MARPLSYLLVLSAVLLLLPAVAVAQDSEPIEASEEQLELNERAVEAMVSGNPARAVALLSEAQRLGELNILALNLGRAYHGAGNCERARQVLESVSEMPTVENPSPERVNERAQEYLNEVDETCEEDEEQADLPAPDPEEQPEAGGDGSSVDAPPAVDDSPDLKQIGLYTAIAGGVVALGGGGGLHLAARSQRSNAQQLLDDDSSYEDGVNTAITQSEVRSIEARANSLDTAALGTAVLGGAALAVGSYLFFTSPEAGGDDSSLSLNVGDDAWSLQWAVRF